MKRALVVGLGVSGQAAVRLLERKGYEVVGVDDRAGYQIDDLEAFDEVVVSPGISPTHPLYRSDAIGEVALAMRYLQGPAIGITGTNGKTTVTLMVAHVLNRCGIAAKAAGNVGTPLSDGVEELGVKVIELSSFQLETLEGTCLKSGIVLNIGEDHLDRYESALEYAAAKLRMERCVKGRFWVSAEVKRQYALKTASIYDQPIESILAAEYKGIEWLNAHAAYALCNGFGIGPEAFVSALESFERPRHRMERVASVRGVTFINDSKGTNPDAVVAALEGIEGPVWLIAGGRHKGVSFAKWKGPFAKKVERVLLVGEASGAIREALEGLCGIEECGTMERAVARGMAAKGRTVLLSPGCASFDQFASYEERGDLFCQLVGDFG